MRLRQQFIRFENVLDRHPGFVFVFPRALHIAAQVNGVDIGIHDRKDLHQIRIVQRHAVSLVQMLVVDVHNNLLFAPDNPLHLNLLCVGGRNDAARVFNE